MEFRARGTEKDMSKYRGAIVGCGKIHGSHVKWYAKDERIELAALCELDEAWLREAGERHGVGRLYSDCRKMLREERIDVVSVCTPIPTHADVVADLAPLGVKAILCEKPIAHDLGSADRMIAACRDGGVTLAVSHQMRFYDEFVMARKLIAEGAIGRVERVHVIGGPEDLLDNSVHTVDLMFYLMGDARAEWVAGQLHREKRLRYGDLDSEDYACGCVKLTGGTRAVIENGDDIPEGSLHHIWLGGSDGEIEVRRSKEAALRYRNAATGGAWEVPYRPGPYFGEGKPTPLSELLGSLEGGPEHRSNPRTARAALEVIMALFESCRRRRRVRLPLEEAASPLAAMVAGGEI
jgi:predicted dehydrogenase